MNDAVELLQSITDKDLVWILDAGDLILISEEALEYRQ